MNTRQRMEALHARPPAPAGMAMRTAPAASMLPSWPQRVSFCPPGMQERGGECVSSVCAPRAHPLIDPARNAELAEYERTVRQRFDAIVPALREIAAQQHEAGFEQRAQQIARERLGFELPQDVLADAWVTTLDMRKLYGHSVLQTYHTLAREFTARWNGHAEAEAEAMHRFETLTGVHDVSSSLRLLSPGRRRTR